MLSFVGRKYEASTMMMDFEVTCFFHWQFVSLDARANVDFQLGPSGLEINNN